jgi:hypothetical protein
VIQGLTGFKSCQASTGNGRTNHPIISMKLRCFPLRSLYGERKGKRQAAEFFSPFNNDNNNKAISMD